MNIFGDFHWRVRSTYFRITWFPVRRFRSNKQIRKGKKGTD